MLQREKRELGFDDESDEPEMWMVRWKKWNEE